MRAFHLWNEHGFSPIAEEYLSRLGLRRKKHPWASIADNGDLIISCADRAQNERLALLPALEEAAWLDGVSRRPRL
jgi:hypothetical protein